MVLTRFEKAYVSDPRKVIYYLLIFMVASILFVSIGASLWSFRRLIPARDLVLSYLTSIATVQASVLAIGVSVLLLGIELITNRFSAQLTSIILENPVFQATFALLTVSIGLDVWLIFNLQALYSINPLTGFGLNIPSVMTALLYFSAPVAILAGVTLYITIRHGIRRGTPEGILNTLQNRLTPDQFTQQAITAQNDPTVLHPLSDVYFITRDALLDQEPRTAHQGLSVYQSVILNARQHLRIKEEYSSSMGTTDIDPYFSPPFREHLPDLVSVGVSEGERNFVDEIFSLLQDCSNLEDTPDKHLYTTFIGYLHIARRLERDLTSYQLFPKILYGIRELLQTSVKSQNYNITADLGKVCYQHLQSRPSDVGQESIDQYILPFTQVIADSLSDTLSRADNVSIQGNPDSSDYPTVEHAAKRLTMAYLLAMAIVLDNPPNGDPGQRLQSNWDTILRVSQNNVSREYLELLDQALIENILILKAKNENFDRESWIDFSAAIMERQGPELLLATFSRTLQTTYVSGTKGTDPIESWMDNMAGERDTGIIPSEAHPRHTYERTDLIAELQSDIRSRFRIRNWNDQYVRNYIRRYPEAVETGVTITRDDVSFEPVDFIGRDSSGRAIHLIVAQQLTEDLLESIDFSGIQRTIVVCAREPVQSGPIEVALSHRDLKVRIMDFMNRPDPRQSQLWEFFETKPLRSVDDVDLNQWAPPSQTTQSDIYQFED